MVRFEENGVEWSECESLLGRFDLSEHFLIDLFDDPAE